MDETVKKAFYASLNRINYFWVILSLILSTLTLFSRAYRWKYMLEPMGYKSSFWNRYHAVMIGYIMNLTIPRAGEASRSLMLFRAEGIPFAKSFGTIVAERVFDIIMLAAVLFLTISLAHSDFWEMKTTIENQFKSDGAKNTVSIVKYILIGFFALGFLGTLFIQKLRVKVLGFLKNVWEGLTSIFKTKHPFYFIGHTLFIWVNYIVYFAMVLPVTSAAAKRAARVEQKTADLAWMRQVAPQVMAAIRNLAISMIRLAGFSSIAEAVRHYAAHQAAATALSSRGVFPARARRCPRAVGAET